MANLKFYKMAQAPVGTTEKPLEAGAVWFNTTNHSIEVYNGATWSAFSGVLDAVVANEVLTVTKYDGSTVSVDFSIYATDEALTLLTNRVSTLEGTVATQGGNITDLQGRMTTVEGKASAAEAKLVGLTGTVVEDIAAAVLVEENRAKGVEGGLDTRLTTLETTVNTDHEGRIAELENLFTSSESGSVSDMIDDAVKAAEGRVDEKLATKADKATYEAYVASNDAAVAAIKKTAEDEVSRAVAEDALLHEKIGVPAGVEGVEAYSKDYTVGQDVKAAKDAAAAAQATIDNFLTGEGIDPNKVENLKEIVKFIEDHGTEYQGLVDSISGIETDVAGLQAKVDTTGTVSEAIATAKEEILGEITANEETTAAALTDLDNRVDALEALDLGNKVANFEGRIAANEAAVATVDSRIATAKGEAIADADGKLAAAKTELQGYADGKASAAQTAAEGYADGKVQELAEGAVADNAAAIAALDAKVTAGLQWVTFE